MKPGEARSTWVLPGAIRWSRAGWPCALLCVLLFAGCKTGKPDFERELMASRGHRRQGVAERYTVACPDVLGIEVAGHPELSGPHPIGVDGRLDLEPMGHPRVEGETIAEIVTQLAELSNLPANEVRVNVAEYRTECLYLFGEVVGLQRAVPYKGQETLIDLLQRIGGITQGALPRDVYVVRTHIAECGRPEVFHVDLEAIVVKHDERTNVRLQPYDQIHVGGTRRAMLEKCVPPWLRPCYKLLCEWLPFIDATEQAK